MEKKLYKPSNGTEGERFFDKFCYQCKHYQVDGYEDCWYDLILAAEINEKDDLDYPDEWCYDENGKPTCTKFEAKIDNEKN